VSTSRNGWVALPKAGGVHVLLDDGVPVRVSLIDDLEEGQALYLVALREAIELFSGYWIAPFDAASWEAGEGKHEAVCPIVLSEEQPTHRIEFRAGFPSQRAAKPSLVFLVRLADEDGDGDGPAYTHSEWDAEESAAWVVENGVWTCEGLPTPGGANGEVTIHSATWGDIGTESVASSTGEIGETTFQGSNVEPRGTPTVHGLSLATVGQLSLDAGRIHGHGSRAAQAAFDAAWEKLCANVPMIVTTYPARPGVQGLLRGTPARTTYRVIESNEEALSPGMAVAVELQRLDSLALRAAASADPVFASDLADS